MKKHYKIILLLGALFLFVNMIDFSSAWFTNTFNNSLTSETLLFTNPGTITRYLAVPSGTILSLGQIGIIYPIGSSAGTLVNDIKRYFRLDDPSGPVLDSVSGQNGTVVGTVIRSVPGIIATAYNFTNAGYVNFTNAWNDCQDSNCSINLWINYSHSSSEWFYYNGNVTSGAGMTYTGVLGSINTAGDLCWEARNTTSTEIFTCTPLGVYNNNRWNMFTVTMNTTFISIYVNGTLVNKFQTSPNAYTIPQTTRREYFAAKGQSSGDVADFARVRLDEIGMWNRTLTQAEITQLYASGAGLNFTSFTPAAAVAGNITLGIAGAAEIQNFSVGNGTTTNSSTLITGLQTVVNNYLSTCTFVSGFCNVPFTFTSGVYNTFIAYNNLNFSNQVFTENSQTFAANTTSGSLVSFAINITYDSAYYSSIIPLLIYNNTQYTPVQTNVGPDFIFNVTLVAPKTNVQVVKPFYWTFVLSNSTGSLSYFNSTSNSQTVSPFSIDDCSTNTQQILNFTLFDEDSRENINGTIETVTNIYTYGGSNLIATQNQTKAYTIKQPARVCITALSPGSIYSGSYEAKYYGNTSLYAVEYKFAQNFTITSTTPVQDISLYDLLEARSTEFTITLQNPDLSVVQGAVIDVQRQYVPLNQFISVEGPLTDTSGSAVAHLVATQVYYNFVVTKQGQLLGTFNNYQVQCQNQVTGDCRISLNLIQASSNPPDFSNYGNLSINVSLNKQTRNLVFNFISTDGNVHLVAWNVSLLTNYNNNTLCTNSQTATSGSFSCIIPITYGNTTVVADLYSDRVYLGRSIFSLQPDSGDIFGGTRIVLGMIMYSTLAFLMIASPPIMIVGAIIGMGITIAFHLVDGGSLLGNTSIFLWYVIAGAIILYYMRNKT